MYKFGSIVLVPFPFTDLTSSKLRPALIVSKTHSKNSDVIVAFITSKVSIDKFSGNFYLKSTVKYFNNSGLKVDSCFMFDKIATLNKKLIVGEIGYLHKDILSSMKSSFLEVFGF